MGGKKNAPPKKTEEEKAEEKRLKVCTNMLKAAKENELAKVQKAVESEGADINFANEQGQTCAHVAAAFGALDVLRYLYKNGALFDVQNSKKQTPLDAARFIGEEDSVLLIEALMDGKSGEEIGLGKDLDLDDDVSMPPEAQTATKADDGGAQKAPPMPSPPPAAPVVAAGSA